MTWHEEKIFFFKNTHTGQEYPFNWQNLYQDQWGVQVRKHIYFWKATVAAKPNTGFPQYKNIQGTSCPHL